jgi:hypothetical protein
MREVMGGLEEFIGYLDNHNKPMVTALFNCV